MPKAWSNKREWQYEHIKSSARKRGRSTGNQELRELYDAVVYGTPIVHDGEWGMATLEVCLAIMQSARERREITLTHQVPVPADYDADLTIPE